MKKEMAKESRGSIGGRLWTREGVLLPHLLVTACLNQLGVRTGATQDRLALRSAACACLRPAAY